MTAAYAVIALVLGGIVLVQVLALSRRRSDAVAAAATVVSVARTTVGRPLPAMSRGGVAAAGVVGRAVRSVVLHALPVVVGCAALFVALDWGLGAAWQQAADRDEPTRTFDLAAEDLPPSGDPRVDLPAMASSPWADRYFAELDALDFTYVPYIGPRETAVHGRYVNTADGIRSSYEPRGADRTDAVEVWFFGGSALWGEGQRDRHTIVSEVARLAEQDGRILRVRNFGLRGYSAFQEMLLFEQELARRPPPDLAVFYHGFNELSTQTAAPENLGAQPTIFQLTVTAEAMDRTPPLPGAVVAAEPSVEQDYLDTSVVHRLIRGVQQLAVVPPAAADETEDEDEDKDVPFYQPPPEEMAEAVDHAEAIYRRSMALIEHVADEREVPIATFWQPSDRWPPYDELTRRVALVGGGVDLSGVLVDPPAPVYLDGVHTNELGARLVAEAMWPYVADRLAEGDGT